MLEYPKDPFINFFAPSILREFFHSTPETKLLGAAGFPVVDAYCEEDGTGVVEYALAGYKKEQLKIEMSGNTISVSACKGDKKTEGRRIARRAFSHSLTIPRHLDSSNPKVSFEDGILRIQIPVREEEKPRILEIPDNL